MFTARQAPFFHFATPIGLPPLGEPFVDHVLAAMTEFTGRRPDREAMHAAFETLRGNPYFFLMLVEWMILHANLDTARAIRDVRRLIAEELGYQDTWLALTPLQRAVAHALREHVEPFSQAPRDAMEARLDDGPPSPSRVQAALRGLERLGLADRSDGGWALADAERGDWIRDA